MSDVTEDEFIDIGSRMAQELQDFVDEAETASGDENSLSCVRELIDEWEAVYKRTGLGWQSAVVNDESIETTGLDLSLGEEK